MVSWRTTTHPFEVRSLLRRLLCAANDQPLCASHTLDTIEDAIVFCQTCRHGGHAAHILDWFYGDAGERSHGLCPVADCNCRCADEF